MHGAGAPARGRSLGCSDHPPVVSWTRIGILGDRWRRSPTPGAPTGISAGTDPTTCVLGARPCSSCWCIFLVLVGSVVWAVDYYAGCQRAPEGPQEPLAYTVEEGAPASNVVDDLAERGVISCGGFVGNLLLRGTGKADAIRAGDYRLTTGMTLDEVMTILTTRAEEDRDRQAHDPTGLPPHPDRRCGGGSHGHPRRDVPRPRRQGNVRAATAAARGREPRGLLVPRDLPTAEEGRPPTR